MKTLNQVTRRKFDKVGDAVCAALMETNANYAEVADAVRSKLNSATSRESVRYYASQLRKQGEALPERARSFAEGSQVGEATAH